MVAVANNNAQPAVAAPVVVEADRVEPKQNQILVRKELTPDSKQFEIYHPLIAQKCKAGQFVVVRGTETAERIPLTIAWADKEQGTIALIFQEVGTSTRKLGLLKEGDRLLDVVGPLGRPSHIELYGTVYCIGGGVGIAPVYPIAKALKEAGNKVVAILGARTKDLLIMEAMFKEVCDEVHVTTDDGSYGTHGFVTTVLKAHIEEGRKIDLVLAIGPLVMMKVVSNLTKQHSLRTIVSLNSIMVDGTGMCGGCRVSIGEKTKFTCVDGPEFDAHQVDFDELLKRSSIYSREERHALWDYQCRMRKAAEKKRKTRVPMPQQSPIDRIQNFSEVALGYSEAEALVEAARCLQCKTRPCVPGCPVDIDIPEFIALIKAKDYMGAIRKIKEKNNLPAICGRVCPQEEQCEKVCILAKKGQPVCIGRLERFAADYELTQGDVQPPPRPKATGKKVAVIGAGPAGLTVAGDLARMGHDVVIYEALHKSGGVLVYGIPEFRLPKGIVELESGYVEKLGVRIETSVVIGRSKTIDDLFAEGFGAVFIGTGAGLPYFMNIPGENLNGVYSANEFLTRSNLMKAYLFPEYDTPIKLGEHMAVVGGGNVAMDSARTALRLGARNVYLIYRRSRTEMPARAEEVENAEAEGVQFMTLTNPTRILGNEDGWVRAVECLKMALGEPDASGRRRPVPVSGSEHQIPVEVVVMAIGQGPNPLLTTSTPDLELNRWGNIVANEETGQTSKRGVFAGGDIVTGAATVILAMGAGKKAAVAIDEFLRTGKW